MTFLHHESCPKCGSRDNLARYADGSAWCFGCHYYEHSSRPAFVATQLEARKNKGGQGPPADCGLDFSPECLNWLAKYNIKFEELYERRVRWSPSYQQLVFLFDNGVWQARNFRPDAKTKYFTQGNVNDHLPIYSAARSGGGGDPVRPPLVLVEDCISAIKVARQHDAMPLLGSHIGHDKLRRVSVFYGSVLFWLDADKYTEAKRLAERGRLLGLSTRVIYTELDPKEYDDETILQYIS